ncbi:hypothetical protein DAEQUDRAFT_582114 [Daedalea quercina L-15889]|uniref:Uncharacterized protein n=1 Tax=Daedalea quercina L-15889 TaxID=1314783 RepID=A0A165LRF4_9APHY|nr:hypothetical protein DAEQUDRAFT_582114 [Daedalea quercina L-15889]
MSHLGRSLLPCLRSRTRPCLCGCRHRGAFDACHFICNHRTGFLLTAPHRDAADRVSESERTLIADVYYLYITSSQTNATLRIPSSATSAPGHSRMFSLLTGEPFVPPSMPALTSAKNACILSGFAKVTPVAVLRCAMTPC